MTLGWFRPEAAQGPRCAKPHPPTQNRQIARQIHFRPDSVHGLRAACGDESSGLKSGCRHKVRPWPPFFFYLALRTCTGSAGTAASTSTCGSGFSRSSACFIRRSFWFLDSSAWTCLACLALACWACACACWPRGPARRLPSSPQNAQQSIVAQILPIPQSKGACLVPVGLGRFARAVDAARCRRSLRALPRVAYPHDHFRTCDEATGDTAGRSA